MIYIDIYEIIIFISMSIFEFLIALKLVSYNTLNTTMLSNKNEIRLIYDEFNQFKGSDYFFYGLFIKIEERMLNVNFL